MTVTTPPVALPRHARPAPSSRTVIATLLGTTLVLKGAGFAFDYLGYYVGTAHGTTAAGICLTVFGIGWCLGQAVCGAMTDRMGQRTVLPLWLVASAAACVALSVVSALPAIVAIAFLLGCTMEVQRPAVSAEINERITSEAGRTRVQSWMYWMANVGVALSGAVGGYLAHEHGYRILFLLNGVACVAAAVIARRVLSPRPARVPSGAASVAYRQVLSDPALRWIAVAAVGAMISAYGLVSVLPLVMSADGLPPTALGTAMIANTVAVLVLSPPLTRLLVGRNESIRYPLAPVLAAGSLILGASMGLAALQHTVLGYAVAAVLMVPGEVCFSVALGGFLATAAPAGAIGRYQAVLSGASALASLTPLGIALALNAGGRLLVAALLMGTALLAAWACVPLARALPSRPRP
ncbi:MFS transporter [Streptomyces sp. NPDC005708]|uniref:MFS transporter n=1 Tax=Streptomyces sp. NPDC005708 TaxID=3154564 RepID=UPI0033FF3201